MYEHVWFAEKVLTLVSHGCRCSRATCAGLPGLATRDARRAVDLGHQLDDLPGSAGSTDGGMGSMLNRFELLDALDSLSPAHRDALVLVFAAEQASLRHVRSLRGLAS